MYVGRLFDIMTLYLDGELLPVHPDLIYPLFAVAQQVIQRKVLVTSVVFHVLDMRLPLLVESRVFRIMYPVELGSGTFSGFEWFWLRI